MRARLVVSGVIASMVATTIGLAAQPALAYGQLPGSIIRVDSVAGGGAPPGGARASGVSSSGEYVLWSTLFASPTEYYVTNTLTGQVTLVTKSLSGQPLTGEQYGGAISANGRYVVYASNSPGLPHPGRPAQAGIAAVYRYDVQTGDIRMENVTATGGRPWGSLEVGDPAISATGRYVAFGMRTDALPGGNSSHKPGEQVYLRDNVTQTTTLVSRAPDGSPGTARRDGNSYAPQVSDDGRFVVFTSTAILTATSPHTINKPQVYLWDRQAPGNGIIDVSHGPGGAPLRSGALGAQISGNGAVVVYVMPSDGHPANQVYTAYRYVIATGKRTPINEIHPSKPGPYQFGAFTVSANGRYVGYSMYNTRARYRTADEYRYDALTGTTELIYRATLPSPTTGPAQPDTDLLLSADGRHAAFDTSPPPFSDPGDTNLTLDAYEWNAVAPH
jgi:hypothetical protein